MKEEDSALLEDVRAFAAQLGFGTPLGISDDAAFQDFAPDKAKQSVNKGLRRKDENVNNKRKSSKDVVNMAENKSSKVKSKGNLQSSVGSLAKTEHAKHTDASNHHDVTAQKSKRARGDDVSMKSLLRRLPPGPWYEALTVDGNARDQIPSSSSQLRHHRTPLTATIETVRERVRALLDTEATAFEARSSSSQSLAWLQQANRGGTTADRVAAMALMVQESPMANLKALDGLIAMMKKRGGARGVVTSALDALKELWIDVLLPPTRKLKYLDAQPLHDDPSPKVLLFWGFEDALKRRFATFLEALEALTLDNLEHLKDRGIKTAYDILTSRPEGEAALLAMLVNKLGDPSRKLASKVGYLLNKLLSTHPGMKIVVVREVERFVFRPGLGPRARYYAVVFLNQIVLTNHKEAAQLPGKLIDLYFTLFKLIIQGRIGTIAVQRDSFRAKAQSQAQARAARRGKKKASVKDLQQEDGGLTEDQDQADRGSLSSTQLGEVDSRMLAALITGVRRAFPFVPAQDVEPLIEAHADALFKLVHSGSFGVATQALLLLHQLMSSRNAVSDRFYRALYSMVMSPDLSTSTKAPMFLSLLFKALSADVSPKRVAAFLKRLVQVASISSAQFACGCLMLVSKVLQLRRGLWNLILEPEDFDASDDTAVDAVPVPDRIGQQPQPTERWPGPGQYNAQKRDPQFANADQSCLWELLILTAHVHPSVVAMARTLLAGVHVKYDGDPLKQLTLGAFLDKFLQKKPKHAVSASETAVKGDSLMQPLKANGGEIILQEAEEQDVAPDEAFFHKFYVLSREQRAGKKKKQAVDEDDLAVDGLATTLGDDDDYHVSDDDSDLIDDFLAGEEDVDDDMHYASEDFSDLEEGHGNGVLDEIDMSASSLEDNDDDGDGDIEEEDRSQQNKIHGKDQVFAAASDFDELIRKDLDGEPEEGTKGTKGAKDSKRRGGPMLRKKARKKMK